MSISLRQRAHLRWGSALLAGLVLSIWLLATGSGLALAHANLVRSVPAANAVLDASPTELRLWFSEAPEPRFFELQLLDRSGRRVDAVESPRPGPADATLLTASLRPLPPGVYTVAWRAVSAVDGHVTASAFSFAVGRDQVPVEGLRPTSRGPAAAGTSGPTIPDTATRWLGYLAMALLAGGFAFFPLVLRPALADVTAAGRPIWRTSSWQGPKRVTVEPLLSPPWLLAMLWVGWGLAIVASLVGALLQAAASAGVEPLAALGSPLLSLLGGTRYGALFWARLLLLGLLGVLLALGLGYGQRKGSTLSGWWAGFGLSSLVMLATSLGAHAAAAASPALAIVADWLHLTGASVWIGGLLALSLALPSLYRREGPAPAALVAQVVGRFSRLAIVCLVTVGLTGLHRAIAEVADWESLVDAPYGTTLLIKLGLVVPLVALAAVNLVMIKRRLVAAGAAPEPSAAIRPWYRRIRLTVGGEVLLVSSVLLATGVLTSLPPAREAFGSGLLVRGQVPDLRVVLVVSPGEAGLNTFDAYVRDGAGQPVTDAEKVALIFTMVEHDMGENETIAENVGAGHYRAQGGYVSMVGTWHAQLLVRRPGRDDVRLTLTLIPRQAPGQPTVRPAPVSRLSAQVVLGISLLVAGLVLILSAALLAKMRWASYVLGLALAVFGSSLAVGAFVSPSPLAANNPVTATARGVPDGSWVEVAHWKESGFKITEPFTVRGPWRVRWRLANADEPLLVMLTKEDRRTILRQITGDTGATSGTFEEQRGGAYALMFHNNTPYDVVVEDSAQP